MKNKIYLDFEDGLDAKYKRWAEEAIHDFILLFPEYEDQFEVGKGNLSLHDYNTLVTVARQNKDNNPNFDLAGFAKQFEQRSDGSYLVSVNKQAALATSNGVLDIEKWSQLQSEALGGKYVPAGPTFVSILKAPAAGNIRGISIGSSIGISAGTIVALGLQGAELKNYFKDIIMHELGHRFNATHEGRKNVVENLGTHCTDADCLMYEYAYMPNNSARRLGKDNPFCSECMASMREYMQNVMKFERSKEQSSVNHLQAVDIRSLPLFKDISEGELIALDNYMRILEENNIQRSPQEQLLDMISIFASARGGHNLSSDKEDNVIGEDKFLLATAKTDWNDAAQLSFLQGKIYSFKRYISYQPPFKIEDMENPTPAVEAVEKAQLNQGNLARVSDEGYWIRKYGQGYFDNVKANPQKELHRFILNINPSEDLFQKLDDFAVKFGCQYKFPHLLSWNGRIDPVVIYTSDDRIAEQQKELVKIAAPYVRRERMTNGLDGTRIADGIFMAKERDKSDILALAQKAEPRLPKLAAKLRQEAQDLRTHPLSLGEFLAYEAIVANINSVPSQNHIVSLPEFNFENPGRREIFYIYNCLKKQNTLMAQKLDDLCDKHNSDWPQIASDPQFKQIKAEFEKTQPQKKPDGKITYLSDINQTEADFLQSYDNYLQKNHIKRDKDSIFFDKMFLLAQMRRNFNYSNTYNDRYIISGKYDFTSTVQMDWKKPQSFKSLRIAMYEAKKYVCYDTELFDKTRPATKNPDGSIPPYAVGGQTVKGDELAKVLIDSKEMEVKADLLSEQWIYRIPYNRGKDDFVKKPIVERFAVNALPDKDLIKKLDDFAKKYKVYYKTATPGDWHKRNDSVVIYCSQPQTPEMVDELKNIVSPYIRKSKPNRMNDLDGTLIADGLVTAKEPNRDNLKSLFDEMKTVHPQMAMALKNDIAANITEHPYNPLSLGQAEAYRLMLTAYKNFKNAEQENVHISNEPLSETAQDKSFKKALREVFQPAAQKEGSTYVEDIKAQNYQARIEHADGSVDHIEASSAVNISLTSADKDGNPQVPGMERFRNIVEYAQKQNRAVTFGDIRSPEFKARLMIACLEANPPVKMKGAPATDKTFVDSLSDDLKKQLHRAMLAAKRRQQPQKQTPIKPQTKQGGR